MLLTVVPHICAGRLDFIKPVFLSFCLISFISLPVLVLGQPGGLAGGLAGEAEVAAVADSSSENSPDGADTDTGCPSWDELGTCGQTMPPVSMQPGPLDGFWDVSAPGAPHLAALVVILNTKFGPFHRGNPNIPSPAQAMWRLEGWERMDGNPFAVAYSELDGGGFSVSMGAFENCNCVSITFRVYPTGNPDVLRGEWQYEDQTGPTQWRRRNTTSRVHAINISNAVQDENGEWTADFYATQDRAGKLHRADGVTCGYGQMRGNCERVYVTFLGDNFAGPHQVWIDPSTYMEIGEVGWVCRNGEYFAGGWSGCGYDEEPVDRVAGIRVQIVMWDGMKSGPVNLWVDGRPLPIELEIGDSPVEDEIPDLLSVTAYDIDGNPVTSLQQNGVYRFEAVFADNHPHAWINVRLGATAAAEDSHTRNVTLTREADGRTFSSEWMQLQRADTQEVQ